MSSNEQVARDRLQNPLPNPDKHNAVPPPFPVSDLPNTFDDPLWKDIAIEYQLSLPMVSALKKAVVYHCWQHMKFSEVFEYNEDTVTVVSFLQWVKAKFSGVISFTHGCSVKVYYLSSLESWDQKIRIDDDEALRSRLMMVSNDRSLVSYIMVSIEQESPSKAPCDDNASTKQSTTVSGLTNQSRGSVQGNFHQRVLTRDGSSCVFCGNAVKAHLKAAHIFDVFRAADIPEQDAEFLQQYEILDLYDTSNGITLCSECHDVRLTVVLC